MAVWFCAKGASEKVIAMMNNKIRFISYIKEVWGDAEVLAEVDGKIVAARQGNQLVTAFHPELNESLEIHKYFLGMCSK